MSGRRASQSASASGTSGSSTSPAHASRDGIHAASPGTGAPGVELTSEMGESNTARTTLKTPSASGGAMYQWLSPRVDICFRLTMIHGR